MVSLDYLLKDLDTEALWDNVKRKHEKAKSLYIKEIEYRPINTYEDFIQLIGLYYKYHFDFCFSNAGEIDIVRAQSLARETLDNELKKSNKGNIELAYKYAKNNIKMRFSGVLEILANALENEAIELYFRATLDKHVSPNSWEDKVEVVRQFLEKNPDFASLDQDAPEKYAEKYYELIITYVKLQEEWQNQLGRVVYHSS